VYVEYFIPVPLCFVGKKETHIRLGRHSQWEKNPKKTTYTESTFSLHPIGFYDFEHMPF